MQRHKCFHVSFLTTLADEPSAFGISLDVLWVEPRQVHVSQSCEHRKQEHVPCQFHLPLLDRMGKQCLYLFTGEIADFNITFYIAQNYYSQKIEYTFISPVDTMSHDASGIIDWLRAYNIGAS